MKPETLMYGRVARLKECQQKKILASNFLKPMLHLILWMLGHFIDLVSCAFTLIHLQRTEIL